MRILHFIPGFWIGGIETLFLQWYKASLDKDIDFELLTYKCCEESIQKEEFLELGGICYEIEPFSLKKIFIYKKSIKAFFATHNDYDVLHVHGIMDYFCMKYAKLYGIKKVIFHAHNLKSRLLDVFKVKTCIYRMYYLLGKKYIDVNFACSINSGVSHFGDNKFTVINNTIDTKKYIYNEMIRKTYRKSLGIESKLVIGHVGRMVHDKNYEYLLKVFNEIHKKETNSSFLIIGDGPELNMVKKTLIDYNLCECTQLLGVRNDVNNLLQAMDGFVFPSYKEGFGIVLIEAQATGLPCIISKNIPKSTMITPIIKQCSYDEGTENWANVLLNLCKKERVDMTEIVKRAGFDFETEVEKLFAIYKRILDE